MCQTQWAEPGELKIVVIGVDWRDRLEQSMTVENKTETELTELTQCCE